MHILHNQSLLKLFDSLIGLSHPMQYHITFLNNQTSLTN